MKYLNYECAMHIKLHEMMLIDCTYFAKYFLYFVKDSAVFCLSKIDTKDK